MSQEETLLALETLAKTLDVEVRYEKGDFNGGLCRIDDRCILLVQKTDPLHRKIHVLARELGAMNFDHIFVCRRCASSSKKRPHPSISGEKAPRPTEREALYRLRHESCPLLTALTSMEG